MMLNSLIANEKVRHVRFQVCCESNLKFDSVFKDFIRNYFIKTIFCFFIFVLKTSFSFTIIRHPVINICNSCYVNPYHMFYVLSLS